MTAKVILLVTSALLLLSCDHLLDVDLPANQISTALVFESVQSADAALATLYGNLRDSSPIAGGAGGSGILWSSYTDDLDCYSPSGETTGIRDLYLNVQNDSNLAVLNYWTAAYKQVYLANSIMEGATHSNALPAKEKQRIKGEALLIRSILYYYLMQIYGNIPYVTTTDYIVNQSIEKTSLSDLNHIIESDLTIAMNDLENDYRNNERIFPNKKVAQLMLAKVYMQQQKWMQAEGLLREIINFSSYTFESDVAKVFQKSGSHILWQLKPKNTNDPTQEIQSLYFSNAAPSLYALTPNLINTFSAGDKRLQQWITPVIVSQKTYYRADKYKNRTTNATEYSIVFRLEEVYLLLAEALSHQNKIEQALQYVNKTRIRAGLNAITMPITQEFLMNEILLENRKEFFTEMGHRFIDLKRNGRLNDLKNNKVNWKNESELWPIPQKEILLNHNLKPQNNGY